MIFIVHAWLTVIPPLVTEMVKLYVPGVVATPISPAVDPTGNHDGTSVRSATPVGRVPLTRFHVYAPAPPDAVSAICPSPIVHCPKFGPTVTPGSAKAAP